MSLCRAGRWQGHRWWHQPGKPTRIPSAHRGTGKPRKRGKEKKTTQNTSFLYKIHKIQIRDNYIQNKEDIKRAELSCLHPYRKVSRAGAGAGSRGRWPPRCVPPVPSPVAGHPAPAAFLLRRQRCCGYWGAARGRGQGDQGGVQAPEAPPGVLEGAREVGLAMPPLLPITALSGATSSSTSSSSPSKYSSSSSAANGQPNITAGPPGNTAGATRSVGVGKGGLGGQGLNYRG